MGDSLARVRLPTPYCHLCAPASGIAQRERRLIEQWKTKLLPEEPLCAVKVGHGNGWNQHRILEHCLYLASRLADVTDRR